MTTIHTLQELISKGWDIRIRNAGSFNAPAVVATHDMPHGQPALLVSSALEENMLHSGIETCIAKMKNMKVSYNLQSDKKWIYD